MKRRIGIALSGGGYRAAAFHLGTLRALDRLGILSKIDVISSVSGGSILSAYYGLHKDESFEQIDAGFRQRLKKSSLSGFLINVLTVFVFPLILSYLVSSWFLLLYLMLIPFGFIIMPQLPNCFDILRPISSRTIPVKYTLLNGCLPMNS